MRQIKFRTWDKEDKQMYYDVERCYDTLSWYGGNKIIKVDSFGQILSEDKYIVMQYTGIKDKNGKEIYEGDIVSFTIQEKQRKEEIIYNENWCMWEPLAWEPVPGHSACPYKYEVIGDIYENPELLKENE